jgi:DNA-binding NarL/FixJ family response regulator
MYHSLVPPQQSETIDTPPEKYELNKLSDDSRRLRIVLADDHPEVLDRFRKIVACSHDVVATAADGESVLAAVVRFTPDVVVCDISMPGMSGFEVARRLARSNPEVKVVFLTVHSELDYVSEASRAGVAGYVLKTSLPSELDAAIRAAAAGESYVSTQLRKTS